jgi:hypothetical protein
LPELNDFGFKNGLGILSSKANFEAFIAIVTKKLEIDFIIRISGQRKVNLT